MTTTTIISFILDLYSYFFISELFFTTGNRAHLTIFLKRLKSSIIKDLSASCSSDLAPYYYAGLTPLVKKTIIMIRRVELRGNKKIQLRFYLVL